VLLAEAVRTRRSISCQAVSVVQRTANQKDTDDYEDCQPARHGLSPRRRTAEKITRLHALWRSMTNSSATYQNRHRQTHPANHPQRLGLSDLLSSAGIEIDFPRDTQFAEWQDADNPAGVVFNYGTSIWRNPNPLW
jgi:hypothetical protein